MCRIQVLVVKKDTALEPATADAIDELGQLSALAQGLLQPITSADLFRSSAPAQQQCLYLALAEDRVVGFLKTGTKHLFYVSRKGTYSEMDPRCVLDFYVREEVQRSGVGLALFHFMLEVE
ncbi:hypothetical protein ATCC90586_000450 [Pythium insidiosum]|nr:hypothetical protein ATCC90586_000450 [Pythium insidiosum]